MGRNWKRGLISAMILAALSGQALAQTAPGRTTLPIPAPPFDGVIADNVLDSRPATAHPLRAPTGAPNVLLFMSDDVGFAMSSTFGGPVATPNFDGLAAIGQRYNRFHTTGICSPSRAALLTGRNHHNAGNGYLSDLTAGYPGYGGVMSPETATIAQVLRLNGYNTAQFGKDHNVPTNERSAAGPFDNWPTGHGFEYFYGFVSGDSDQYRPDLYRGIDRVGPDESGSGEMLDQRLADGIIDWVHNQKAAAPDKPFFVYWAPGSTHAPHQAPPEWIARFKGRFVQGWDKLREETWRRQLAMGIIPKGTKLTPRPAAIPAWDSQTPTQKAFAARTMEVAAAELAFEDAQVGRVLGELQRMGLMQSTLIVAIEGDNGASGEGGPRGTIDELRSMARNDENEAWLEANTDKLGGPDTYENYPAGWAWAMNAPLRWTKQYASMLGGIRNGMIMAWDGHVAHPGAVCPEFGHLIDIAPTLLEAAHLPAPTTVLGFAQKPMDGQSLLASLGQCQPDNPRTQYFEMGGKAGLWQNGWFASYDDGRLPWEALPPTGPRPQTEWTLYNLNTDYSQSTDLSAKEPARLAAMETLWRQEAERNHVFPLDHRFAVARASPAAFMTSRTHFDFWGKGVSIPAIGQPLLFGHTFTVTADLVLAKPEASGVVLALGSKFGGWSLYLDHGKPSFTFARSTDPSETSHVTAATALPQGPVTLTLHFQALGFGKGAKVTLASGGTELASLDLPSAVLMPAGGGETLDVGRDTGVPVTDYATPHGEIEGEVPHVVIDYK